MKHKFCFIIGPSTSLGKPRERCWLSLVPERLWQSLGKPREMLVELSILTVLLLFLYFQILLKNISIRLPVHDFPFKRDDNYRIIKKSVADGTLPKMFRPRMFPCSEYIGLIVLANYDVIKEAFARKELSSRLYSENLRHLLIKKIGLKMEEKAIELLGPNDRVILNGFGKTMGIGDGDYDATHKALRVQWHDTMKRLVGRNKITEIIQHCSAQVNKILIRESNGVGIDPKLIFMNGTMNVVTGFSLGVLYDVDDEGMIYLTRFYPPTHIYPFFSNGHSI